MKKVMKANERKYNLILAMKANEEMNEISWNHIQYSSAA